MTVEVPFENCWQHAHERGVIHAVRFYLMRKILKPKLATKFAVYNNCRADFWELLAANSWAKCRVVWFYWMSVYSTLKSLLVKNVFCFFFKKVISLTRDEILLWWQIAVDWYVCMYMYTYFNKIIYTHKQTCMYIYIYIYVYVYIYMCIYMYTYIYISICICTYIYIYLDDQYM